MSKAIEIPIVTETDLGGCLPLIARGKVRDIYEVDKETLLFVATDRISAYDVILKNGIPNKGALLTLLSSHWFSLLTSAHPSLKTHLISLSLPPSIPASLRSTLQHRTMYVRKYHVFPVEAIVRGYITGSAWKEYVKKGTVHGIQVPTGLKESDRFPEGPIYTPSTKAEQGMHDENIHPDKVVELLGEKHANQIKELALALYTTAHAHALSRGLILADTKFEFGLDTTTDDIVLIDEVLTPDSSRYWPASSYTPGKGQESFDKQYLRDFLTSHKLNGVDGVEMPADVVVGTARRYREVFEMLTGRKFEDVVKETGT